MLQVVGHRPAQAGMGDVVEGMGGDGQVAARQLVLPLRPGLDPLQPARQGKIDGLMIADLEMQEGVVLDAAPVPAVERLAADEIDRAGDIAPLAFRHDQQDVVGHALADQRIEGPRQIGPSPFAAAGVHVEGVELVPDLFRQIGTGQPVDADAVVERRLSLLAQGLALARSERFEKGLVIGIALVEEMELLVGAVQEARRASKIGVSSSGAKGDMGRGETEAVGHLLQPFGEQKAGFRNVMPLRDEEARASRRGKGDRALQLWVIAPASPLEGIRPAVVEHVFALAVAFQIARHRADQDPVAFEQQVLTLPAAARRCRAGSLPAPRERRG